MRGADFPLGTGTSVFAFGHNCGRTLNYVSFRWYFTMICSILNIIKEIKIKIIESK